MIKGRVVVVTGAAGGMGEEITRHFIANDDLVIASDNSAAGLARLDAAIGSAALHPFAADLSSDDDIDALARFAGELRGRVDVLVNAAGFFPVQPFSQITGADWRRVIDINLTGVALTCRAMLPFIIGRGWGRIVTLGSASIYAGVPGQAHYVAAKAGVVGLTRTLAREYGAEGVTVNVVAPGVTMTDSARKHLPAFVREKAIRDRSLQREATAVDIVGTVAFLASPGADFVTGQTIIVDGGSRMV